MIKKNNENRKDRVIIILEDSTSRSVL